MRLPWTDGTEHPTVRWSERLMVAAFGLAAVGWAGAYVAARVTAPGHPANALTGMALWFGLLFGVLFALPWRLARIRRAVRELLDR